MPSSWRRASTTQSLAAPSSTLAWSSGGPSRSIVITLDSSALISTNAYSNQTYPIHPADMVIVDTVNNTGAVSCRGSFAAGPSKRDSYPTFVWSRYLIFSFKSGPSVTHSCAISTRFTTTATPYSPTTRPRSPTFRCSA